MDLPLRTYYYEPKHTPSDAALIARIGDICLEFPRYGYRRVTKQLQREGWIINHKKVARIMRERNWSCRSRKKRWLVTTDSDHGLPIYPNLTKDLSINTINQLWVADIIYIRILTCFVYLAVMLDAFSRRTIAYALSRRVDTRLTPHALCMAIDRRQQHQVVSTIQTVVFDTPHVTMSKSFSRMVFRSAGIKGIIPMIVPML